MYACKPNEKEIKNMTRKSNKRLLSLILSTMLIVAMAFSMTACGDNKENQEGVTGNNEQGGVTIVGEGTTVFPFVVVDADGNEKHFEVHTEKTMVGDALIELDLIAGDTAEYGLYVKTVDGITVDYDTDGKYWAFYINGEYAMTGVDATPITEGEEYSFKVE